MRNHTPRTSRADSEEQIIEIANQMIPGLHMADIFRYYMGFQSPDNFFDIRSGLYTQLEVLSNEKLGFIIGKSISRKTLWRVSCLAAYGQVDLRSDGGKQALVYLASIVIAAAIYDILATEHAIRSEMDPTAQPVAYIPPLLLKEFVLSVRLKNRTRRKS